MPASVSMSITTVFGAADSTAVSVASRRAAGQPRRPASTSTGTVRSVLGAIGRPAALRAASARTCPLSTTTCHGTAARARTSPARRTGTIFPRSLRK